MMLLLSKVKTLECILKIIFLFHFKICISMYNRPKPVFDSFLYIKIVRSIFPVFC